MRRAPSGETKRTPEAVEAAVTTEPCAAPVCCERAASCAAALPVRTIAEKMTEKMRRAVYMIFLPPPALRRKALLNLSGSETPSEPGKPFTNLTRGKRLNG